MKFLAGNLDVINMALSRVQENAGEVATNLLIKPQSVYALIGHDLSYRGQA